MQNKKIIIAHGDGIGPEIMDSTLRILQAARCTLSFEAIEIGERLYMKGISSGISNEAMDAVKACGILLKAPITTPQGKGYKSLNVTFRKALGLFANIRPVIVYNPFVKSMHSEMDMVIVRENEEDLYTGIEYKLTHNSACALKMISRTGCARIIKYAFEYARANGRKKVTCVSKDNIMKITDGSFHSIFDEISKEYPDIAADHYIVDIGAARIAAKPKIFDVIVTLNLYGDIISDIAAEVSGSVGLAGSSNIGAKYAMFEAVHGSAPDIAGQDIANPSGLLNAAILMLNHIGHFEHAALIQNAWLKTLEDGIHTADIYSENSKKKVGTKEFTDVIISNIGQKPAVLKAIEPSSASKSINLDVQKPEMVDGTLIGADAYIKTTEAIDSVAKATGQIHKAFDLIHIALQGMKVWPSKDVQENNTDLLRLRYVKKDGQSAVSGADLSALYSELVKAGFEVTMFVTLKTHDNNPWFTKAQGE